MRTHDHHQSMVRHAGMVLGGAALLVAVVLSAATTVSAATTAAPAQLSIAISNGRTSVATGNRVTYAISLRNLGTTGIAGLRVSQTLPPGLRFVSADAAGATQSGSVVWKVDLTASSTAVLHTTMVVSTTPAGVVRLATVACASQSATGPPLVCASDSDLLPAGTAATVVRPASKSGGAASSNRGVWYLGGLIASLVIIGGVVRTGSRRRRSARAPAPAQVR